MKSHEDSRITKVFIVDDSELMRHQVVEVFSRVENVSLVGEGDSVQSAVTGILASKPDVVILDMQLPDGTGIDVLKAVKARLPAIKFIILTNYPLPQYRDKCMSLGASYFFDKFYEFNLLPEAFLKLAV